MAKKKKNMKAIDAPQYKEVPSVNVKKASNGGFVVSKWTENGEVMEVTKTWNDAQKCAKRLLKG